MFMGFGLLIPILIIAAIAYAVGWRPQGENNAFSLAGNNKSALEIAKERYAGGELSKDEFEEIRRNLSSL
jgi:putative membrane protein